MAVNGGGLECFRTQRCEGANYENGFLCLFVAYLHIDHYPKGKQLQSFHYEITAFFHVNHLMNKT